MSNTSCRAEKDNSYYNANSGNPNTDLKMYWKDTDNILQDLSEFSGLYVEFHSCVWSWMKYSYSDNDIDENDYWYMGSVPPMGANVAFSLYGSLAGEKFNGCSKDTFINSFYTNSGFTDFAKAMNYVGMSGFSSYTGSGSYTAACKGGYGVGCDKNGFGLHKYSTDECDPQYYSGTSDNLSNLNSAMESAQCVQIYDADYWQGYDYGVYNTPLELLTTSTACDYMNYKSPDGECPDPYGKVAYYIENFNRGIKKKREDPYDIYHQKVKRATRMMVAGGVFLAVAIVVLLLGKNKLLDKPAAYLREKEREFKSAYPDSKGFGTAAVAGAMVQEGLDSLDDTCGAKIGVCPNTAKRISTTCDTSENDELSTAIPYVAKNYSTDDEIVNSRRTGQAEASTPSTKASSLPEIITPPRISDADEISANYVSIERELSDVGQQAPAAADEAEKKKKEAGKRIKTFFIRKNRGVRDTKEQSI